MRKKLMCQLLCVQDAIGSLQSRARYARGLNLRLRFDSLNSRSLTLHGRGYGRRCSVLTSSTKRACCDGRVERPARTARVSKNVIWNPHCAVLTVVAQNIHRPISVLQWHGCLRQLLCGTAVHALHVHEGSVAYRTLGLNAGEVRMLWVSGGGDGDGGGWWW
jgi:hypothetical protein